MHIPNNYRTFAPQNSKISINMKKFFLLALALISGMVGVQKINAATLYAVLSSDKTTVEFYYDDKRSERGGKTMWESDIYRGNENKITTVTFMSSVASAQPTTGYHFFYNLYNLTTINNLNYLKTSEMINMEAMFYNCAKLKSLDISHFNTDKVKLMNQMFADCRALETLTLPYSFGSTWTTTSMRSLFYNCQALKEIKGATYFNTTSVTDMACMFYNCQNLDMTKLVKDLDTRSVTDMGSMFYSCKKLTTLNINKGGYIWDKESLQKVNSMFKYCSNLKTIYCNEDLSKSTTITDGSEMFAYCSSLVGGKGTTSGGSGLAMAHPDNSLVPGYFTGEETSTNQLYKIVVGDILHVRYDKESTLMGGISINYNLNEDDRNAVKTIKIDPAVANAQITNIDYAFYNLSNMTKVEGLQYIKTEYVTSMKYLFYNDAKLESIDLRNFDLAGANCSNMFQGCTALKTIYCDEDYSSNLTASDNMFKSCSSLKGSMGTTYDATHLDASYARPDGGTAEPGYFTGSEVYTVFNSSNGVLTFYYDQQRETRSGIIEPYKGSEDQERFTTYSEDIKKVVFDKSMANKSLRSVRALLCSSDPAIQLSNLTTIEGWEYLHFHGTDMAYMFYACSGLTSIDLFQGGNFSTENVTDFTAAFAFCSSLETINMTPFNTANAEDLSIMFAYTALKSIDISMFNVDKVVKTIGMFSNSSKLRTIYCNDDWSERAIDGMQMFDGCTSLVGGSKTKYDENHIDIEYARLDRGNIKPGYFTKTKTAIDAVPAAQVQATKVLRDGVILIERNGKTYTVSGQEVQK